MFNFSKQIFLLLFDTKILILEHEINVAFCLLPMLLKYKVTKIKIKSCDSEENLSKIRSYLSYLVHFHVSFYFFF